MADALLLGLVETGVPRLGGGRRDARRAARPAPRGRRASASARAEYADDLPAGRLVVADARGPVAVLFGDVARRHAAGHAGPRACALFAVGGRRGPAIHVEEALWACAEALAEA